jgi:predicted PurR-regulated permease PerM
VWIKRCLIALTTLALLGIAAVGVWLLGHVLVPIVLLIVAGVLAFVLYPAVRALERLMPPVVAVLITFLLVVVAVGALGFILVKTLTQQLDLLVKTFETLLQPSQLQHNPALVHALNTLGISPDTIHVSSQDVTALLRAASRSLLSLVGHVFSLFIDATAVATISAYLLLDGPRISRWLRTRTPLRSRTPINTWLDVMNQTMGGFFRGQLLLAAIMSVACGVGAYVIGVPFAFLLAVIVFVFEFIPVVGAYFSGAIGVVLALTQGWQPALLYLLYSSVMQGVVDGQFLTPRILGKSVHIHPIISILVLFAGAEAFGLLGAFLAVPVAGVVQAGVAASWSAWRAQHPDQFPDD